MSKSGPGACVQTTVTYCLPPREGEVHLNLSGSQSEGKVSNFVGDNHEVLVRDLRRSPRPFSLHQDGFQLVSFSVPSDIDWQNNDEVKARYHIEAERLIKRYSGATRVQIAQTILRNGKVASGADSLEIRRSAFSEPVPRVHNDMDARYVPERLRQMLPDEAETLMQTPFAIIQVWRPLKGPVVEAPLAFVHPSSVKTEDLIPYKIELPGQSAASLLLKHSAEHKFFYAKDLTTEEALVFKCYDSRQDAVRCTPHCSFRDPTAPLDAPPRESIELRALAFFEDQPQQAVSLDM